MRRCRSWSLPTSLLSGAAAAGGIALINAIGNVSGYVGPFLIGYLKDLTGSFRDGVLMLAGFIGLAGILTLALAKKGTSAERRLYSTK